MPRLNRLTILGALSAVALFVTACSDSSAAPPPPSDETSEEATETETTTTASSSAEQPPSDIAVTPPGTRLTLGERAVIPYDGTIDQGVVGVTVTGIESGDPAAFQEAFGEDVVGAVPYYIRFTVENLSGTDMSSDTLARLYGSTEAGSTSTGVVLIGDVTGCENVWSPDEFTAAGATYESCQLTAAPEGDDIVEVGYEEDDYEENPIVWTR